MRIKEQIGNWAIGRRCAALLHPALRTVVRLYENEPLLNEPLLQPPHGTVIRAVSVAVLVFARRPQLTKHRTGASTRGCSTLHHTLTALYYCTWICLANGKAHHWVRKIEPDSNCCRVSHYSADSERKSSCHLKSV